MNTLKIGWSNDLCDSSSSYLIIADFIEFVVLTFSDLLVKTSYVNSCKNCCMNA